jgi:hypothetical protein
MTTAQNLIYSIAAAARILKIEKEEIKSLEIWQKVVLVKIHNQKAKFISRQEFCQHFADWRKSNSQNLKATPHEHNQELFSVSNPDKNVRYQVSLRPQELICNCQDWSNQKEYLGKACCKHCYSVLNYLNYESLKEYIERKEERVAA